MTACVGVWWQDSGFPSDVLSFSELVLALPSTCDLYFPTLGKGHQFTRWFSPFSMAVKKSEHQIPHLYPPVQQRALEFMLLGGVSGPHGTLK